MFKKFFKKNNSGWIIWLGIFFSYIIVGLGVYLWQSSIVKEVKKEQAFVVNQTLQQQQKLSQDAEILQKSVAEQMNKYKNNIVDWNTIKIGDRLANGMILKEAGRDYAIFEGQVVVSGNYIYSNNPADFDRYNEICLLADENSQKNLPRVYGENQPFSVCFSNKDIAKNKFGPRGSSGKASVVVDNLKSMVNYDFNWVELIKTIEITK